jgi:thiol-disulfide isomerase/thioredoxin
MRAKILLLIFLSTSLFFLFGCSQESSESQQNTAGSSGAPAQDLSAQKEVIENATFTDLDGNEVSLDQFEGKLVLIDFWESWCGPCLQVFPAMADLREEYPDNFEVLAVTVGIVEGPEEAKNFIAENDYPFTWLYDENGVFDKLGGLGIPYKVFISPTGELLEIEMGSRGREGDYNKTEAKIQEYL